MVTKLVKNEFKDSSRKFVPILGIIATASVILTMTINLDMVNNIAFANLLLLIVLLGLGVAIVVLSFMAFIDLLYTSLYNKNGYRLFTLPVETWEIVTAKVVVYAIWNVIILCVTLLAFLFITLVSVRDAEFWEVFRSIFAFFAETVELRVVLTVLLNTVASGLVSIALFLFAGSVVNSRYVQNQRGLKMFILYLVLTALSNQLFVQLGASGEFIFNAAIDPTPIMSGTFNPLVQGWSSVVALTTNVAGLRDMALMSVLYLIVASILFFGTVWFWDHKLEIID